MPPGFDIIKRNEHSPFFKEIRGLYFWIIHEINADFYGFWEEIMKILHIAGGGDRGGAKTHILALSLIHI